MTATTTDNQLSWLLSDLIDRVPHARSALLASTDGIVRAWTPQLGVDDADHLSAIASGLWSLGSGASRKFVGGGAVRQLVVEIDGGMLFVASAGFNTCISILTDNAADPGQIGFEMARLVQAVRPHLETAPRHPARPETLDPLRVRS